MMAWRGQGGLKFLPLEHRVCEHVMFLGTDHVMISLIAVEWFKKLFSSRVTIQYI